jgi:hypothetical protein
VLIEALAARGVSPREADELEFWEAAAVLGANRAPSIFDEDQGAHEWNVARAAALEAGQDEPQFADFFPPGPADNPLPFLAGGLIGPSPQPEEVNS